MPNSSRRLKRGVALQLDLFRLAGDAAAGAESAVRRAWRRLLAAFRAVDGPHRAAAVSRAAGAVASNLGGDLGAALLDFGTLGRDHGRKAAAELTGLPHVFDAPGPDAAQQLVYSPGWRDRYAAMTRLASPDAIASRVFHGVASGKSIRELSADLLPVVDGVRSTARRVAHDAVLRAAHEGQFAAWQELGDVIVGFRINAVLDTRTRPEHRARDGTVYWKNPRPGQKGLRDMPHPPHEADGSLAYNCRCFLTPEFA